MVELQEDVVEVEVFDFDGGVVVGDFRPSRS
jgi:hypothetical protein